MKKRVLLLYIALILVAFTGCIIICIFASSSTHVSRSYNDRNYYMSKAFTDAAIVTWQEFNDKGHQINWFSFNHDTNEYYIAAVGGNQIVTPSENIKFLFDHGALGFSFSGGILKIYDYMSYGQEAGCIISPLLSNMTNHDVYWEMSGYIAYPFRENR